MNGCSSKNFEREVSNLKKQEIGEVAFVHHLPFLIKAVENPYCDRKKIIVHISGYTLSLERGKLSWVKPIIGNSLTAQYARMLYYIEIIPVCQ